MDVPSKNWRHSAVRFASPPADSQPRAANPDCDRPKEKLLYLALSDPDLEVTGATVRMGAFVKYLSRYYDVTLINMAGSGHRVEPEIEERFRDRDNRLGVSHRVRIDFSLAGYFLISPRLYRQADMLIKRQRFDYLLADYGLAGVYGKLYRVATPFR